MRAFIPEYSLLTPDSLSHALGLLAAAPGAWKPFAGGTDLMVMLEAGKLVHKNYLNIWDLEELRGIVVRETEVVIGALTTYAEIQSNETLLTEFPMLCQAASETGGLAIQNRGTLGGNIVNASPAADSPPALLAYDAEVELICSTGSRRIPYADFHSGYKQMNLRDDELLSNVHLPRNTKQMSHYYRKVGTRKAQAISKVCFAGTARLDAGRVSHLRIALGSVAPVPLRCRRTEQSVLKQANSGDWIKNAINELEREITPISDIRSTKDYRLRVSKNLLEDFLKKLI